MWAIFILLLFAVGPLFSEEYRTQPVMWLVMGVCWLALIGLAYGKWLDTRSKQAMIDTERNTRR